jgi:hypothetical protein
VASFQFVDGLFQVPSWVDAQGDAIVDQGVRDSQALATTLGAGEKEISASNCKIANTPSESHFLHKAPARPARVTETHQHVGTRRIS